MQDLVEETLEVGGISGDLIMNLLFPLREDQDAGLVTYQIVIESEFENTNPEIFDSGVQIDSNFVFYCPTDGLEEQLQEQVSEYESAATFNIYLTEQAVAVCNSHQDTINGATFVVAGQVSDLMRALGFLEADDEPLREDGDCPEDCSIDGWFDFNFGGERADAGLFTVIDGICDSDYYTD